MRFQGLDLNLLVALDALLAERHVSRAARRLNLTQSATSGALARLRDYFGDDLLVMRGRMMALTPRGVDLVAPVGAVLEQIRIRFPQPAPPGPVVACRALRIMADEGAVALLMPALLRHLAGRAPDARLDILPPCESPAQAIERQAVDLALLPANALAPRHPALALFAQDHVVVGCAGNASLHRPMTEAHYLELGHVAVFGDEGAEGALPHRIRLARRREVLAPSVLALPALLAGSRRIATLPRHLARHLAAGAVLAMQDVPFPVTPMRLMAQWHGGRPRDPVLAWVVEGLQAGGRRLDAAPEP